MLCLRRIIERFRAGVGGPQSKALPNLRFHFGIVVDKQDQADTLLCVNDTRIQQFRAESGKNPFSASGCPLGAIERPLCHILGLLIQGLHLLEFRSRCSSLSLCPLFRRHLAILPARSSKRNGPFVPALTGGNA